MWQATACYYSVQSIYLKNRHLLLQL